MYLKMIMLIIVLSLSGVSNADFVSAGTSKVFHYRDCSTISKVLPNNLTSYPVYDIAILYDKTPCLVCKPIKEEVYSPDPNFSYVSVGTSKVFHYRNCSTISKVLFSSMKVYENYNDALNTGRTACLVCKPVDIDIHISEPNNPVVEPNLPVVEPNLPVVEPNLPVVEPNNPSETEKTYIISTILIQGHDCGHEFDPNMVGVPLISGVPIHMVNEFGVRTVNDATYNKNLGILAIRLTPFDKGVYKIETGNSSLSQTEIDGITINSRGKYINLKMFVETWLKGNMNLTQYAQNADRFYEYGTNSNVVWSFVDGRWIPTVNGESPVNPPVIEPNNPVIDPNVQTDPNNQEDPNIAYAGTFHSPMYYEQAQEVYRYEEREEVESLINELKQIDPNTLKELRQLIQEVKERQVAQGRK